MSKVWMPVLMALLAVPASWADSWHIVPPVGDICSARSGHTMVEINGRIYVYGGRGQGSSALTTAAQPTSVLVNDVCKYIPGENIWAKETPVNGHPPARAHHASVAYQNKMYVFFGDGNQGMLGDVWVYDPATKVWSNMPESSSHPTPRVGHSAVVVGDRILIVGGKTTIESSRELWSYDPKDNTWLMKQSHTLPLSAHRAVTVDGKMYIHGGMGDTYDYPYLFSYDVANDTWAYVAIHGNYPSARAFHILATDGKKIWSTGGKGHDSSGTLVDLSDTWEFDLTSMKWTQRTDGPAQSMSAGVVLSQNSDERDAERDRSIENLFMFGGMRNGQYLDEQWQYSPEPSTPVRTRRTRP